MRYRADAPPADDDGRRDAEEVRPLYTPSWAKPRAASPRRFPTSGIGRVIRV